MRHAILGVGGIGGLLGAAFAGAGDDVVLLMRPGTLAGYGGQLTLKSVVLGDFEVDVPAVDSLDREVDVVWIATKATQLEEALSLASPESVGRSVVIPLLNGIDHVAQVRRRYTYANVVAGAMRVESERAAPWTIEQRSPFLRVELGGAEQAAAALRAAGVECTVRADETSLLWEKLAFLAPIALATTALDGPLGDVRDDARFAGCRNEAIAVAQAEGAAIDAEALRALQEGAPASMRSSMQKDVVAGRTPELDAIAGPILSGGDLHGIPTPCTEQLADLVAARLT